MNEVKKVETIVEKAGKLLEILPAEMTHFWENENIPGRTLVQIVLANNEFEDEQRQLGRKFLKTITTFGILFLLATIAQLCLTTRMMGRDTGLLLGAVLILIAVEGIIITSIVNRLQCHHARNLLSLKVKINVNEKVLLQFTKDVEDLCPGVTPSATGMNPMIIYDTLVFIAGEIMKKEDALQQLCGKRYTPESVHVASGAVIESKKEFDDLFKAAEKFGVVSENKKDRRRIYTDAGWVPPEQAKS